MASCQYHFLGIGNHGFGPVLSSLTAHHAAFKAKRCAAGHRATKIDLHLRCHRGFPHGAYGLAHGFIEKSCNNSTMEIARMALKGIWHHGKADDGSVCCEEEFQAQSCCIGRSAAKATIMG